MFVERNEPRPGISNKSEFVVAVEIPAKWLKQLPCLFWSNMGVKGVRRRSFQVIFNRMHIGIRIQELPYAGRTCFRIGEKDEVIFMRYPHDDV